MATKIPPTEWREHKETILAMRRSGVKVRGVSGIVEKMEREHGFIASYCQYELQLAKWQERKNLTAIEWCRILRVIDQYREADRDCSVQMNGRLIPTRTLNKKSRMYRGSREYKEARQVSADALPECITIRGKELHESGSVSVRLGEPNHQATGEADEPTMDLTESQLVSDGFHVAEDTQVEPHNAEQDEQILDFDRTAIEKPSSESLDSLAGAIDCQDSPALGSTELSRVDTSTDQFIRWNQALIIDSASLHVSRANNQCEPQILALPEQLGLAMLSPRTLGVTQLYSRPNNISSAFENEFDYSQHQFSLVPDHNDQLFPQDCLGIHTRSVLISQPDAPCSFPDPDPQIHKPSSSTIAGDDSRFSNCALAIPGPVRSSLATFSPTGNALITTLLSRRNTALQQAFQSPIHRSIIMSIENNFAGLDDMCVGDVLNLLRQDDQIRPRLVEYVQQTPRTVATALVDKLLVAAIEEQDSAMVTELLSTHLVKIDDIVCTFKGQRYTAIQRSAMMCSTQLFMALVHAGANVTKTIDCAGSILNLALQTMRKNRQSDAHFINTLLEHGAKADVDVLLAAIKLHHADMISLVMSNLKENFYVCFRKSWDERDDEFDNKYLREEVLLAVIRNMDDCAATETISQLIQMGTANIVFRFNDFSIHSTRIVRSAELAVSKAATLAVQIGHCTAAKFLLKLVYNRAAPLAAAVRNRDEHLIDYLWKSSASQLVMLPCKLDGDDFTSTPLAEAIRSGNDFYVCLFEKKVPWTDFRLQDNVHVDGFRETMYAASEVGNFVYVRKLLDSLSFLAGKNLKVWDNVQDEFDLSEHGTKSTVQPKNLLASGLRISVEKGYEQIALCLLDAGAEANDDSCWCNSRKRKRKHVLFQAMYQRKQSLFDTIVECDLYLTEELGRFCIAHAVENGLHWATESLLAMRPYQEEQYLRAVLAAIRAKNKSMFDWVIVRYNLPFAINNCYSEDPVLTEAIQNSDIKIVRELLELGADPRHALSFRATNDASQHDAPHQGLFSSAKDTASESDASDHASEDASDYDAQESDSKTMPTKEILITLLRSFSAKYPGGIRGFGNPALRYAIELEDIELLDEMIKAKLDVNARDGQRTALGAAISGVGNRQLQFVQKLLQGGSDVNGIVSVDEHDAEILGMPRRTALLEAIITKEKALVELLIEYGADIHRPARLGLKRTPLQQACETGSIEIVDLLLDLGANPNEAPAMRGGATSLQLCAIRGSVGIALRLLEKGADVHAAPSVTNGRTPLQGAAENGRLDMISLLWKTAGIRKFSSDDCIHAMNRAQSNGHMACHDLIKELLEGSQDFAMPQADEAAPSFGDQSAMQGAYFSILE